MKNKTLEEGLKEFDEMMIKHRNGGYPSYTVTVPDLRRFLTTFAEKIREGIVEEVEGMKKTCEWCKRPVDEECQHYNESYNKALDDLLAQLKDFN